MTFFITGSLKSGKIFQYWAQEFYPNQLQSTIHKNQVGQICETSYLVQ